jgi:hypothetical protein
MPRVFPMLHEIRVAVASGNITSKVYHTVFEEYPFSLTVTAGSTSANTSVNITEPGEIKAIRVYGSISGYSVKISDSYGTIYQFGNSPTSLIDSNISVPIAPKTLTVSITLPSAPSSDQSFTGVICVQTRKLE